MFGSDNSIENSIVSVCDILLCRDSDLLSSTKAMLRCFVDGVNSVSAARKTSVPLIGEAVFYPDTVARALYEMCSQSGYHANVPIEAWYALAATYSTGEKASKDVFVKFLHRVAQDIPNDATVNLVVSAVTLKIDSVYLRRPRRIPIPGRRVSDSADNVHFVAFREEGKFLVQRSGTTLAELDVEVKYAVHLSKKKDYYRDVGVVPHSVTVHRIEQKGEGVTAASGKANHNLSINFQNEAKKTYCVRVPLSNLTQRAQLSTGYIPSAPAMDNAMGLQKTVLGYVNKRLMKEVCTGSDITVRALSAISGIHASRFVVVGHHAEVQKVGSSETFKVVDRVITRLKCEGKAVANVCAQISYTVGANDSNGTSATFSKAKISVMKPGQPIDGIKFLMGDLRSDGLQFKIDVTARGTRSAQALFQAALTLHTTEKALEEHAMKHGITRVAVSKSNDMLINWATSGDYLLTAKGINRQLLTSFISMVLRDTDERSVTVDVEKHVVAHRGVVVGASSGSKTDRDLYQHNLEEHFTCIMSTTNGNKVALHVCASYIVHDYKSTNSGTKASLGKLNIGMRTVDDAKNAVKDVQEDIKGGCLVNSDFVWFNASAHEVFDVDCKEFADEIGKIEVADGTNSLLTGSRCLYKVTKDSGPDPTRCLITECLGPIITRHAELLLEDKHTAYAGLLGNPTSCDTPNGKSDGWLYDGSKIIVDRTSLKSDKEIYLVPHQKLGHSSAASGRRGLINRLFDSLGTSSPVAMLEAIVNLAQQESAFRKFLKEAISIALLRIPCDVQVVDTALFIKPQQKIEHDDCVNVTVLQHLLLEPKSWWSLSPRKLHAVVGYNVGVTYSADLRECLEFSNASVHLRYLDSTVKSLDPHNHVRNVYKDGKVDRDAFYFSATDMLGEGAPVLRVPICDILSAIMDHYHHDEYAYVIKSNMSTTTQADKLLENKVKYCIERFVSLCGASEVLNVAELPLQHSGTTPVNLERNIIQVYDLSGHLLKKSECKKLASFIKTMLESGRGGAVSSKVSIDERGVISDSAQDNLEDPETLLGSLKTGMMVCRSLLVKEKRDNGSEATVHLVLTCDVKTRSTTSTAEQIVVSEVCFRVLTDKELSREFHASPASFFGNFERYNKFISSLRVITDLAAAHLASTVVVEQAQITADEAQKRLALGTFVGRIRYKGGVMTGMQEALKPVNQVEKGKKNRTQNKADYFERRCANLLDITFEHALPPSVEEIKRAMEFLVHVASDGKITIAEIAALNKSTLYTNYSKANDDTYSVTHSAEVDTANHGTLSVQFTYKASRAVDSASQETRYILSDAELVVRGNRAQTSFDGQSSTTMRLPQNVEVSKEKWNTLVSRYNKLSATKEENSLKRKVWNGIKKFFCAILSGVKGVFRALAYCFCCCFCSGGSVSESTRGNPSESRAADDTLGFVYGPSYGAQHGTSAQNPAVTTNSADPDTKVSGVTAHSPFVTAARGI
ncbi:hypothetical protein ANPL_03285 [Anaplasma platys]|uniref:Uncharacterized protein n=1 Tax=Anaplasma platys TaxID=949 RepID=A0A858PYP6_9RICK|nr:hypothetical protein [Anaplasma platys]QJC27715.1 hypothetical protein ANPL_03285 [Anaplasma platys]